MRGNFDRFNSARVPCGNQDLRKALFKGEYMGKLLRVNIDSIFFIENVFFNFLIQWKTLNVITYTTNYNIRTRTIPESI
jgi:hypothetical protein